MKFEELSENKKIQVLQNFKKNKEFRVLFCENDFKFFAKYYFEQIMTHGIPEFHNDYYEIAQREENLCIVGYRGCAKTGIFGLIYIVWCICYRKESFIIFLAFNKGDATGKVRNIVTALKTNQRIIDDFGYLYEDETSRKRELDKMPEIKGSARFITTNLIRVESFSLDQAARGFVFYDSDGKLIRPGLVVGDDITVKKNSRNKEVVDKTFSFLVEELFGGIKGRIIFLLNVVAEYDVTSLLEEQFKESQSWVFRKKAIIENSQITWKQKYVWTEKEAQEINKNRTKDYKVESIESFKDRGMKSFNINYMNIPEIVVGDCVFDEDLLFKIKPKVAKKKINVWINKKLIEVFIFEDNIKSISLGVDVALGGGQDYTSFTGKSIDRKLVLKAKSNKLEPFEAAHFIKVLIVDLGFRIYKNALVIERNNAGIAVNQELRFWDWIYRLIYRKKGLAKKGGKDKTNEVGFITTGASKEVLIGTLSKSIQNRDLELSLSEIYEFKRYIRHSDGSMGASGSGNDDEVISSGLAEIGINNIKY